MWPLVLLLLVMLSRRGVGLVFDWIPSLVRSATAEAKGIDNRPTGAIMATMLADTVPRLRVLAELFPGLTVTSGFRSQALNYVIGGTPGSLHSQGRAVDVGIGRPATEADARRALAALRAAGLPSRVAWYTRKGHIHVDNAGDGLWRDDGAGWIRVAT